MLQGFLNDAPIRGIAVDFDGVIVHTQPLHLAAWRAVFTERSLSIDIGPNDILGVTVEQFVAKLPVPPSLRSELAEAKQQRALRLAREQPPLPYPTVPETLRRWASEYSLAVVSSAEADLAKLVLEKLALQDLFRVLIFSSTGVQTKPHAQPYLTCAHEMGVPPAELVAVEDSPIGVAAARAAGLRVIAVTNTADGRTLSGAHAVVATLADADTLLRRHASRVGAGKAT
jgi:HAD superfamily hydrolase (TIGR01509 family)